MSYRMVWVSAFALLAAACASDDGDGAPSGARYPRDRELRVNMLQAKATHNS